MHDGYTLEIIYLCFIVKENYWNYCRATKGQFNYLFFIFIFKLPKVTRVVFSRKKRTLPLSVVCSLVIFCGFYNLKIMVLRSLKVQVYFSYLELLHTYRRQYFCIMCHKTSTFYFHYRIKLQFSLQIIAKKNPHCCSIDRNSIPASRKSCRCLWISYSEPLGDWIFSYFETTESSICFLQFHLKQVSLEKSLTLNCLCCHILWTIWLYYNRAKLHLTIDNTLCRL